MIEFEYLFLPVCGFLAVMFFYLWLSLSESQIAEAIRNNLLAAERAKIRKDHWEKAMLVALEQLGFRSDMPYDACSNLVAQAAYIADHSLAAFQQRFPWFEKRA